MFNAHFKNRIQFSHRRMKTAIDPFERTSTKKPFNRDEQIKILIEKAKIAYYKDQNFVQTVQILEDYLQCKPNDNQALYLCGVSYLHLDEPYQAIRKLQKISFSYVNKQQSFLLLAMSYSKVENSDKSLEIINECLRHFPTFQEGYCYRGKLYLKFQQFSSAQKDFSFALKINPSSFISRVALGDCYYQQHRYELAIKLYNESLHFLDMKSETNLQDITLKKGICYFQVQRYLQVVQTLQKLTNKESNSESYFYLGVSYLKINRKSEGILNLEYCIRLQAKYSKSLIQKSFKILIELYLNDYQFYEAINLLKLVETSTTQLSCKYWKNFVQSCMLIIKSHFKDGLAKLNQIYDIVKVKRHILIKDLKITQFQNEFMQSPKKIITEQKLTKRPIQQYRGRKSFSLKHVRKASLSEDSKNKTIFRTITTQKSGIIKNPKKVGQIKLRKFFQGMKKNNLKITQKTIFTEDQVIFIMPILLKFKAYGQFFMNNYLRSLDTYQEYESYIKNVFGREMNQLAYNRVLCQAFLLNQTELYKECLSKYDSAIEEYQNHYNSTPVQPVLCKISTLLNLSLPYFYQTGQTNQTGYEYLQKVLDINTQYSEVLKDHHLSHYYLAIMYFLCEKYTDAQSQLQKCLKMVEQCSWKYLYLKGCLQLVLENYYDAIKQFTAGLILEQSPDLYLGRSISFLLQGSRRKKLQGYKSKSPKKNSLKTNNQKQNDQGQKEQKLQEINSEIFIQNSFQDLQKFIELQVQQDKISLWVTQLLFYNQAFEQAVRALQKVENKHPELLELQFWLKLYEGEFQECGEIGNLIMDAFEGKILTEDQQHTLLTQKNQEIIQTLTFAKLHPKYEKWIVILHLFKREKFALLVKYMQKQIFESQSFEQQVELKYNIGITYLIQGQKAKALHSFQNLLGDVQQNQKFRSKIIKIMKLQFEEDECLPDLVQEFQTNGNHRLSQYLPYKSVEFIKQKVKRIYVKPSIPFPDFPKPNILIKINKEFIMGELDVLLIEKRIEAPWIKRNKEKIQFTEEIVDAYTDFLKQTKEMTKVDDTYDLDSNL